MGKYDNYSYAETLEFFDGWYDHDRENLNYADVLIGMKDCTTIDECISVWKRVYNKYLALINDTGQSGHKSFDEDLNTCLNENLLRLIESKKDNLDQNFALECLANMRQCKRLKAHQKKWEKLAAPLNLTTPIELITKAQEEYEKARDEYLYGYLEPGTNGFNRVRETIVNNLETLKSYGYKTLPYDIVFLFKDPKIVNWLLLGGGVLVIIIILAAVGVTNFIGGIMAIGLIVGVGSVMLSILKWAKG